MFPGRHDDTFGVGYYYYDFSDDLQEAVGPLIEFDDEQGLEVFYNVAVTPWFHVSADLQVIDPVRGASDTAVLGGLRASVRF